MKSNITINNLCIHFIEDKNLVPVIDHPLRKERKILDRQKDFDAVALCLAPNHTWDDVSKDEYGKPFLQQQFLGISHSQDLLVVAWQPTNFGMDIQKIEDRIHRIAPKFTNAKEKLFALDAEMLTLIWSAKESVFKFFGHHVDFAEEMTVQPFPITDHDFILEYHGKHHKNQYFRVSFAKINDAYLTLAQPL